MKRGFAFALFNFNQVLRIIPFFIFLVQPEPLKQKSDNHLVTNLPIPVDIVIVVVVFHLTSEIQ